MPKIQFSEWRLLKQLGKENMEKGGGGVGGGQGLCSPRALSDHWDILALPSSQWQPKMCWNKWDLLNEMTINTFFLTIHYFFLLAPVLSDGICLLQLFSEINSRGWGEMSQLSWDGSFPSLPPCWHRQDTECWHIPGKRCLCRCCSARTLQNQGSLHGRGSGNFPSWSRCCSSLFI